MNNLEKWLISIEPEKVIEEIRKRACSECPAAEYCAFDKMLEERKRRGKMQGTWRAGTTGRDIFHCWMEDGVLPGQMEFDDLLLEEDEEW